MKSKLLISTLALGIILAIAAGHRAGAQGYIDTSQNLYFMSLLPTLGMSENQAISAFPSFRPATESEMSQLWIGLGVSKTGIPWTLSVDNVAQLAVLDNIMATLGVTSQQDGYPEMFGLTASSSRAGFDFGWENGVGIYYIAPDIIGSSRYNLNIPFDGIGTFMVQTIPEPRVFAMLGLGLLGILHYKRRTRARRSA